jgi:hypothetical protein
MHRTPRRDAIGPDKSTRLGRVRVALVLISVAAVAADLCGGVEAARSAPPLSSPLSAVVTVPQVIALPVSVPSVPTPTVSVPSAPTPSVSVPPVSVPPVSVPSTPTPSVSVPSVPPPSVSVPSASAPTVSAPSVPMPAVQGTPAGPDGPSPSSGTSAGSGSEPSTSSAPSDSASPRALSPDASGTGRGAPSQAGSRVRRTGGADSTAKVPATRTSPQAVRRALRELHGCVPSLSTDARSLLRQRAGSGSAKPRSLAALSVSLEISRAAVINRLRRALGRLRTVAQTTGCAGTSIATDLQTGSSTLSGDEGGAPTADRSAVLGVGAHGGPSSQRGPASGSEAAPRPATETAGPGTELLVGLVLLMLAITGVGGLASRRVGPSRRPRPRRTVTPRLYSLAMRAGFRYSHPRDALVLRGIGERFGPVLVRDSGRGRTARPPLESGLDRAEVRASRRSADDERNGRQARRHAGPRR